MRSLFNRAVRNTLAGLTPRRRGSVLIMVVSVLVLLALVGTAFVSTTRIDRLAAAAAADSPAAAAITDAASVSDSIKATIAGELFDTAVNPAAYRPASSNTYHSWTSALPDPINNALNSDYLASRLPELFQMTGGSFLGNNCYLPGWRTLSRVQTLASGPGFYGPYSTVVGSNPPVPSMSYVNYANTVQANAINLYPIAAIPTSISIEYADGSTPKTFPALQFVMKNTASPATWDPAYLDTGSGTWKIASTAAAWTKYLAADADGDGVADSLLFPLNGGQPTNGVTYYAAVRVIDQNSAVNACIASEPNGVQNFSPANLDLASLLQQASTTSTANYPTSGAVTTEENNISNFRFDTSSPGVTTPVDDSGASRADFSYANVYDQLWHGLGRRLDYPGLNAVASGNVYYQAFSLSEGARLAYRFGEINPLDTDPTSNIAATSIGDTNVERQLEQSLYGFGDGITADDPPADHTNFGGALNFTHSSSLRTNRLAAYPANRSNYWFDYNFNLLDPNASMASPTPESPAYAGSGNPAVIPAYYRPLRSEMVTRNAVSAATTSGGLSYAGVWNTATTYGFGAWVKGGDGYSYACIQAAPAGTDPTQRGPLPGTPDNSQYWEPVPWNYEPAKASVNTATFGQLWLAYWNTMHDGSAAGTDGAPTEAVNGAFRNPIRDPRTAGPGVTPIVLAPSQTVLLRSALAAVNTIDLRDTNDDVTSRTISLPGDATVVGSQALTATVFGAEKSVYISEALFHQDETAAPASLANNFIAIELCNPYPTAITLTNWQLASITRTTTSFGTATFAPTAVADLSGLTVPAATAAGPGFLVIDNSEAKRATLGITVTGTPHELTALDTYITNGTPTELVMLRPRLASGAFSSGTAATNQFTEFNTVAGTINLDQLVPVDQLDLTNILATAGTKERFLYRRGSDINTTHMAWNFTYAGPYVATSTMANGRYGTGGASELNSGWFVNTTADLIGNLGAADGAVNPTDPIATQNTCVTNEPISGGLPQIQVNNVDMGGWNKMTGAGPYKFPFGGFARNGDILQVPFIGSYTLRTVFTALAPPVVVEMNALPIDASMTEDGINGTYDPVATETATAPYTKQIGRFCPVGDPVAQSGDFSTASVNWINHWAMRLFDNVTVQAPHDDYLADTDQTIDDTTVTPNVLANYPPRQGGSPIAAAPVGNATAKASLTAGDYLAPNAPDDTVGVNGLININTASWQVLATVPWYSNSNNFIYNPSTFTVTSLTGGQPGTTDTDNIKIAKAIVQFRDGTGLVTGPGNGPFHTLFDLYKVPLVRGLNDAILTAGDPTGAQGDFAPGGPASTTPDGVRYDFKERFLLLNNVSNLITTRSDSFTAYVVVQAWQNANTTTPKIVAQARQAFIVDRNAVTAADASTPTAHLAVTPVPTN